MKYTKSAELAEILAELQRVTARVQSCKPQTPLISTANHLTQACRELGGLQRWAERREARENQTPEASHGN